MERTEDNGIFNTGKHLSESNRRVQLSFATVLLDPLAMGLKIVKIFNLQKLNSGSRFPPASTEEACGVLEHYDNVRPWAEIAKGSGSWEQG